MQRPNGPNRAGSQASIGSQRERDVNHDPRFASLENEDGRPCGRWARTGKAWGLIVENLPRRLCKEPVSTGYYRVGSVPAAVDSRWIMTAATRPRNERDRALAAPGLKLRRNGALLQRAADGLEVRVDLGTKAVHGRDDRNGDTGCNQAILDGRGS